MKPDALQKGIIPNNVAITLGVALALAKEHLLAAETRGVWAFHKEIGPIFKDNIALL